MEDLGTRGWRLGYSGDLGAQAVAPKWLLLGGLASDDGIDIVFEIQGVLAWWVLMFQIALILQCSDVKGIRIWILRRKQEFAF